MAANNVYPVIFDYKFLPAYSHRIVLFGLRVAFYLFREFIGQLLKFTICLTVNFIAYDVTFINVFFFPFFFFQKRLSSAAKKALQKIPTRHIKADEKVSVGPLLKCYQFEIA